MPTPNQKLLEHIQAMPEYQHVRMLEDGTIVGLGKLMFTTAIYMDMDEWGYGRRFCFESPQQAMSELQRLQCGDDEPTGWIAKR